MFSAEEVADFQGNVREKLIYPLDLWKFPPSRCYNCDETSVYLLPLGTRGWKDKQEQAMAATNGKLHCTVGLAIQMEFSLPWYSHIVLKGTTPRSLPSAWPDNMLCACTETHWQTIESMLAFVTFLDNKLQGQSSAPDLSSMLLWSTCVCFSLCPSIHFCFINPDKTSVAQPADIGVMKPHKDALATMCGNFFATTVLDTIRAGGRVVLSDIFAQGEDPFPQLEAHCGP